MKKRRIDLTVKEQFAICNKTTDCNKCAIILFCWDANETYEQATIGTVQRHKDWLNEEIDIPDEKNVGSE